MPRQYNRGTPVQRFQARVLEVESGCHEWQGCRQRKGYGRFGITPGQTVQAHRFAYELAYGSFPEDLCVLHRCDNPACCNPEHLFLGTRIDNNVDMRAKGRGSTPPLLRGTRNPRAKLTEADVLEIRRRHATREFKTVDLAAGFGVSTHAIEAITSRRNWKWLA